MWTEWFPQILEQRQLLEKAKKNIRVQEAFDELEGMDEEQEVRVIRFETNVKQIDDVFKVKNNVLNQMIYTG